MYEVKRKKDGNWEVHIEPVTGTPSEIASTLSELSRTIQYMEKDEQYIQENSVILRCDGWDLYDDEDEDSIQTDDDITIVYKVPLEWLKNTMKTYDEGDNEYKYISEFVKWHGEDVELNQKAHKDGVVLEEESYGK